MGVRDLFGQSGENHQELLKHYQLTEDDLIAAAAALTSD
jgi:transketolase C-terminal domain/subunit